MISQGLEKLFRKWQNIYFRNYQELWVNLHSGYGSSSFYPHQRSWWSGIQHTGVGHGVFSLGAMLILGKAWNKLIVKSPQDNHIHISLEDSMLSVYFTVTFNSDFLHHCNLDLSCFYKETQGWVSVQLDSGLSFVEVPWFLTQRRC